MTTENRFLKSPNVRCTVCAFREERNLPQRRKRYAWLKVVCLAGFVAGGAMGTWAHGPLLGFCMAVWTASLGGALWLVSRVARYGGTGRRGRADQAYRDMLLEEAARFQHVVWSHGASNTLTRLAPLVHGGSPEEVRDARAFYAELKRLSQAAWEDLEDSDRAEDRQLAGALLGLLDHYEGEHRPEVL